MMEKLLCLEACEMTKDTNDNLQKTPLYDLHVELGGKMVAFAGYSMPVQYPLGILKEHLQTRGKAGLFDVSHMGQAWLVGDNVITDLETLIPADIKGLKSGQQRYSQLLNDDGGILDDLMITKPVDENITDRLLLVVNAACKEEDFAHIKNKLGDKITIERLEDRALLALQGPASPKVAAKLFGDAVLTQPFMSQIITSCDGIECWVARAGYTGEDGYEISITNKDALTIAKKILADNDVEAIGLGARDSLRLESALCLYGNDIDVTTTPVEATLMWSVAKCRREEGGFPGHAKIMQQLADKPTRKRVGIMPEGRAPARQGTIIADLDGNEIGVITSGGFGPSVGKPVAMGYVKTEFAKTGTVINLLLRGKKIPANIAKMPFVPAGFYRR